MPNFISKIKRRLSDLFADMGSMSSQTAGQVKAILSVGGILTIVALLVVIYLFGGVSVLTISGAMILLVGMALASAVGLWIFKAISG